MTTKNRVMGILASTALIVAAFGTGPAGADLATAGPDTRIPPAPGRPVCVDTTENSITLDWPTSTDDIGVVAYDIFHLGTQIGTAPVPGAPPYTVTGLQANFQYQVSVFARDAAGNVSDTSPEVLCKTRAIDDANPPSAPAGLTHANVTPTTVDLAWTASADDRGVTAYQVIDGGDTVIHTAAGTPPTTSTTVTGLTCNTAYALRVRARDAAGNLSAPGSAVSFTTAACSRGVPRTPTTVAGGWDVPWDISWYPDGSAALVTERDTFRVYKLTPNGTKTQVGTVPNSVTTSGEGGLMGVAMSPTWNGTTDTDVFFMHTSNDGGRTANRVVKMTFNGTTLSNRAVLNLGGTIRSNRFHNGGRIKFGPDGYLYVTTGDAQQPTLAPDTTSLNGKILRITKTGAAAPGNAYGRVYTYGHRNAQGLAWDSAGRLWSSELGNADRDELNLILPGRNYGWPACEGTCTVAGTENPKKTFPVGTCSPSGIAIVNDTVYMAGLRGQRLWRIELNGTSTGATSTYFVGTYGRLRAVEKVPGANALWLGSTNSDANGDGSPDVIRRVTVQ